MHVLNKYAQMRGNKNIGPAALQAFRAKNDLFEVGDAVVYADKHGVKSVLIATGRSKRFKATRLKCGKWSGLRVSGRLRHAEPHEVARCLHHT